MAKRKPDLAASISFRIVTRTTRFRGIVRITGAVKNAGTGDYVSGPNQQVFSLYEHVPGGQRRLVASRMFHNVRVGSRISLAYERPWDSSSPAEGEFPPAYIAEISFDPDILLDSNPKNDDSNASNNSATRSGTAINDLFSRS